MSDPSGFPVPEGFSLGSGVRGGLLSADSLAAIDGIDHAFETRNGSLAQALARPVLRLHQVHGSLVRTLPDREGWAPFLAAEPEAREQGDALVTDLPGAVVAVGVADCLPILVVDPRHRVVAAVHGGWRSLAGGILGGTLVEMAGGFHTRAADCVVAIGPGIGPCCFEVGHEVLDAFDAIGLEREATAPRPDGDRGNPHCDLRAVAVADLTRLGVDGGKIAVADLCTRCHSEALWSYRADGDAAGRMLAGVMLTR